MEQSQEIQASLKGHHNDELFPYSFTGYEVGMLSVIIQYSEIEPELKDHFLHRLEMSQPQEAASC